MLSKREAARELSRPCGRFRSVLTTADALRIMIAKHISKFDPLANVSQIVAPGTPLNWHTLLRYLHKKKVIVQPAFNFKWVQSDLPKIYTPGLYAPQARERPSDYPFGGFGYGRMGSVEEALSRALGETLERAFLQDFEYADLVYSSYSDLRERKHALNILDLSAFLPWQEELFPLLKRNANTSLYWVRGETLNGQKAYIPAQLVFWTYGRWRDKKETVLSHSTTNGAAGHFSKEEAVLAGLLENIQRDGFLIYWLNNLSPRVIDVTNINDPDIEEILASMKRYGLEIYFLNTTSDIDVPSITCAIVDRRTDEPMLALGASTGFDLKELIVHSADEALAVLHNIERNDTFTLPEEYKPFSDPALGHRERLCLWRGEKMLERFAFFISGESQSAEEFIGEKHCGDSPHERLEYVNNILKDMGPGYEVYLYHVQNKILKTIGYHVVQTTVPKLIPLHLSEHLATLGSERLREVPQKLGFTAAKKFNPWPHPFP